MTEPVKASFGRRFWAFFLDSQMATLSVAFVTGHWYGADPLAQVVVLFAEVSILTMLTQSSAGQRILRLKVVDFSTGGFVSPGRILARTLMICLVIPAVFMKDGRGYHEHFTNTTVVRI